MSRLVSIQRINYLVDFLRKKPATFAEITSYFKTKSESDGRDYIISQKTLKRDMDLLLDLLKVEIEFCHSIKKYKIIQDTSNEINLRIMESYDTFNALKIAADISQHIYFEQRKAKGAEHLSSLMNAIKQKREIACLYQKFWDETPAQRKLLPLALKENQQRWYLVAIDKKDQQMKTFGLDRILEMNVEGYRFEYPENVNVEETFRDCFGIISDEDYDTEEIILAFTKHQAKYIKSLPIHHSQQIVFEDEKNVHFKVTLKPTHDFMMEILSHGTDVEILEPAYVREEIKGRIQKMMKKY